MGIPTDRNAKLNSSISQRKAESYSSFVRTVVTQFISTKRMISVSNVVVNEVPKRIITPDFDLYELNRQLDITKSKVFMGTSAAFLGPLMSMMNFVWTAQINTAATNGTELWWNPFWFLKLDPEVRKTVLLHELWHTARLHMVRCGDRNPLIFNYACDIRINNDLEKAGYLFTGTSPWLDHSFDQNGRMAEEDIYDALMAQGHGFIEQLKKLLGDAWLGLGSGETNETGEALEDEDEEDGPEDIFGKGDIVSKAGTSKEQIAKAIGAVVQAAHQARIAGHAGDIPGEVETLLKQFLSPIVPWEILLHKFFHDLLEEDYSWARPNRRFQDIYLPHRFEDDGKLDHLIYYLDVSGSVTDAQVIRFNSEVKYIKDTFKPKKLTLVQFDTRITQERSFEEEEEFSELVVIGRGGTDLTPVREHMIENKPTAAVIFSDLCCGVMEELPFEVPTIWVAIGNKSATVKFGELIHIRG